jgi:hypothetical protein
MTKPLKTAVSVSEKTGNEEATTFTLKTVFKKENGEIGSTILFGNAELNDTSLFRGDQPNIQPGRKTGNNESSIDLLDPELWLERSTLDKEVHFWDEISHVGNHPFLKKIIPVLETIMKIDIQKFVVYEGHERMFFQIDAKKDYETLAIQNRIKSSY